ncbi:MAG: hypothetical protein F9K19_04650 [Rhizobiaceae bacterium]|nr:MAG: hypothetical protein F9K19_04650 [Rhizobiaceae bacterium]CAG0960996.1 Putative 2-hydroxyacid dehydrogenase [Rhizobiaceae bacterium]
MGMDDWKLRGMDDGAQDGKRGNRVLVVDLVGLAHGPDGAPDPSDVKAHIEAKGGFFHVGPCDPNMPVTDGVIGFFYQPNLHTAEEILSQADGRYDAVIAAATAIPAEAAFPEGGVRIGAGTGNMQSRSWAGPNGGGAAPLMNTPGFNSRATAQMALKAILRVLPDLPVDVLHQRVLDGTIDTGRDLHEFPTAKLEGQRVAVLGYGNIGRELAKLCRALGMDVVVYARPRHRDWICSEGFRHVSTVKEAVAGADVVSVHLGLGSFDVHTRRYENAGLVGAETFAAMKRGAVLVNYDRGEVIDATALGKALADGTVAHCAVDADLFAAPDGSLSGPLLPYRELAAKHSGKLHLLPHAAADTDHPSRVEGAKQAIDQIYDAILRRIVTNAKGPVPQGYTDGGLVSVRGIGEVTDRTLLQAFGDPERTRTARLEAERLAALLAAVDAAVEPAARRQILDTHPTGLVMTANRLSLLLREFGIEGRR